MPRMSISPFTTGKIVQRSAVLFVMLAAGSVPVASAGQPEGQAAAPPASAAPVETRPVETTPVAPATKPEPSPVREAPSALAATGEKSDPSRDASEPSEPAVELMLIDDVREGMKGVGRTVMHGTEITEFNAEVLGVMKSYAPGRDLVLCRLSGGGLETSGVVAGMSGSPIYIDGKLLGAVAYAWPYAKEPIAGVTPIAQMKASAEKPMVNGLARLPARADGTFPVAALNDARDLWSPLLANGTGVDAPTDDANPLARPVSASPGGMQPIAMPLAAAGIGPATLARLQQELNPLGMTAVAAGGAGTTDAAAERAAIAPGSSLSCGLITGDMDLSGIGTTTHVEGNRVWGWGHPMMLNGRCEYSLRAGYIHHVNSKLTVSTKMGSPLGFFGAIDADVGACVAGQLGRAPDLMPITLSIRLPDGSVKKTHVQVVRHPALIGSLTATVFSGVLEELGSLPADLTTRLNATIDVDGEEPIHWHDTYSGSSYGGSDGVLRALGQIASTVAGLSRSPFGQARLNEITCSLDLTGERRSAVIDYVRLPDATVEPGETVEIVVGLKPFRGEPCERTLSLTIPKTLPPGEHEIVVCDAPQHLRATWSEQPHLMESRDLAQQAEAYRRQLSEPRDQIFARLALPAKGLSLEGVAMPRLPAGARAVLAGRPSSPTRSVRESLVARQTTEWVIEGDSAAKIKVVAPRLGSL